MKADLGRLRVFLLGGYGLAALLALTPALDVLARTWPLRFALPSWRFGMLGIAYNAMVTPALGLLLAIGISILLDHRRVGRTLGIVAVIASAGALLSIGLFVLDYLQVRADVTVEARPPFDFAARKAMASAFLGAAVICVIGVGAWRATGGSETRSTRRKTDAGPVFSGRAHRP